MSNGFPIDVRICRDTVGMIGSREVVGTAEIGAEARRFGTVVVEVAKDLVGFGGGVDHVKLIPFGSRKVK